LPLETGDRLANLLVGLDQGAGTFYMWVWLPGSRWLGHGREFLSDLKNRIDVEPQFGGDFGC